MGRSPSKVADEGKMVDTDGEEKERRRRYKVVLLTSGVKSTNLENIEALYAYVLSWVKEEEEDVPFLTCKGVDEYWDPVETTSLSANFSDVFPDMSSLLNYHVERTVIINDITPDKKKVLGDKINKTFRFNRMERRMEEVVCTFQILVEEGKRNGGNQHKRPLAEN